MLEYDRINISKGIDINKTNASKAYDICHCWYFLDKCFKYIPYLCSDCHDLMQKSINFNNVAIISVKESDYRIHFWYMNKDGAINIVENSNLNEKSGLLYFLLYKNQWKNYLLNPRKTILDRAKEYNRNNRQRLKE